MNQTRQPGIRQQESGRTGTQGSQPMGFQQGGQSSVRQQGGQSGGIQQGGQPGGMQQGGQSGGMQQGSQFQQGGGPPGQLFPTQNYLPEQVRTASIELLNQVLVDATDLLTQLRAAHWNLKGPNFVGLHELFEDIYEDLAEHVDDVAERATALGGEARATARITASASRIPELPEGVVTGMEYVELLADRLAILDANLGEAIRFATEQDDLDTADLLNDVSREISKDLWFLEAHLQTRPISGGGQQQMGQAQQTGGQQMGQQPGGRVGQSQQPTGQGQQSIGQQSL